ncbi:MAG: hypothetical protein ACLU1X_07825 [Peptoniphilus grossensis]
MLKCLDIHKGLLLIMLFCILYELLKKDKKSEIEVSDYLYFKSIFVKFNNSDNDCREIRAQKIDFLKTIFAENLSHARHIEMERMTFNSIYTVLIAGIFAFVNSNAESAIVNELILLFGFFTGFILYCISIRWKDVYNRHLLYAKVSYIYLNDMLFPDLFPDEKTVEMEGCSKYINKEFELFDNEKVFSLYCFKPAHITEVVPECKYKIYLKTYQYFLILDIIIEVMILIAFVHITGILNI